MVSSVIKLISPFFVPQGRLLVANLTLFCVLISTSQTYTQENVFSAQIITDVNFSQIRGDLLAGYHRVGYGAGLDISYKMADRWRTHIRLMYRNVGSRNSPHSSVKRSINVHMAQIPVYASYLTWWDNGLPRIHFDIGMAYGRIVNTSINFPAWEENLRPIQKNDYSVLAGMGFWFNHHHGLRIAYHRSISTLMKNDPEDISWKLYYISMQYQYKF